jgi:hypothetical protein
MERLHRGVDRETKLESVCDKSEWDRRADRTGKVHKGPDEKESCIL